MASCHGSSVYGSEVRLPVVVHLLLLLLLLPLLLLLLMSVVVHLLLVVVVVVVVAVVDIEVVGVFFSENLTRTLTYKIGVRSR